MRANTQFFVEWMGLDLIRDPVDGAVLGVTAMEMETGDVMILQARARPCSPPAGGPHLRFCRPMLINTGDGVGMAARAGIPLEDMEFCNSTRPAWRVRAC